MSCEAEPVYVDKYGQPYYFGTPENPFNFQAIQAPMRSLETMRLLALGGQLPLRPTDTISEVAWIETRKRTAAENQAMKKTIRELGRLPLGWSRPPAPSEHRPAA